MIRSLRSRLTALASVLLLVSSVVALSTPSVAQAESASVPATVTATPTTALSSGSTVAVSVTANAGYSIYQLRARLCSSAATINNAGDFTPTLSGSCVNAALAAGTDADVVVTTSPGSRSSASLNFKVGTGSTTFTKQDSSTSTIACGNATPTSCKLVVELSMADASSVSSLTYKAIPLTFGTVPGAPTSVTAAHGNTQSLVSWTAPASAGTSAITGYTVTASPGGATCTTATTSCTVTGLTNGTAYTFTAKATSLVGDSVASSASAAVTPSATPYVIAATPTTGIINGTSVGMTITADPGYSLYQARARLCATSATIANAGDFTPTLSGKCINAPLAAGSDSDVVALTGPSNRTSLTMAFRAGVGTTSFTRQDGGTQSITCGRNTTTDCRIVLELSLATPANASLLAYPVVALTYTQTAPDSPAAPTATRGNASASVSWTAPAANGSAITGYTVTASPGGATCTTATTSCTVSGLTNGTAYTFVVKATNSIGSSADSSASNSVTPGTVPGAPTSVTAAHGNAQSVVSWTAPASNGGYAISGYAVTASPGGATCTSASTSCTVTGLSNGTAYTFTVKATNEIGDSVASSASAAVTPTVDPFVVTATPTTNLSNGTTITVGVTADAGYTLYQARVRLCSTTGTIANAGDFAPTLGGRCINAPLAAGSDSDVVALTTPSNRSSLSTGFRAGVGSTTFTKQDSSTATISCGVSSPTSCRLVVEISMATPGSAGLVSYASVPLTYSANVPSAPSGVSAVAGAASALVSWTASSPNGAAVTGYTVSASPQVGGVTRTCTTVGTSCTVNGLTNGVAYTFTVKATNSVGDSSASTASSAVTPVDVPAAPTGVGAVKGVGQATVSWTAGSSNGSTITGYTVTASPGGATCTTDTTSCIVTGLTNGTAYTFTVKATNAIGDSVASSASAAVTPGASNTVPGAPTGVAGVSGNAQVTVSWTAPASDGGATITGYTVSATPQVGGVTKTCTTPGTSCTVIGLTNGVAYTFTVKATNSVGDSLASTASSSVTPATVPAVPTGIYAVRGNTAATIYWTAPVDNGGSAITSYQVQAYNAVTNVAILGKTCTQSLFKYCTITGLTNATNYKFAVRARNAVNYGAYSALTTAVAPSTVAAAAPAAPTNVVLTPGNGEVTISWTAAVNNGATITQYKVQHYTALGVATLKNCVVNATSSTLTSCTITGLVNDATAGFAVNATNSKGTSAYTTITQVNPTLVKARKGNASITATWTWTAPATKGGSAFASYSVQAYNSLGVAVAGKVCSPVAPAKTCVITGLTNGTAYSIAVIAKYADNSTITTAKTATVSPGLFGATAPAAPTGVAAVAGTKLATVSWTAAANNGATVTLYTVQAYNPSTNVAIFGKVCTTTTTTCQVLNLTTGTNYYFKVTAKNDVGTGVASTATGTVIAG